MSKCITEYNKRTNFDLEESVVANLKFFIKLRNKIEHRHIEKSELDTVIFGECQALLYNYESLLTDLFGQEYAINENLVYSLQFSRMRTKEQQQAHKEALSSEAKEIKKYVEKYRSQLSDEIFNSQTYSIKLIQIPKISNTNRSDLAIEFVRLDKLSEEDQERYEQVTTIIKDKIVTKEAANVDKHRPSDVWEKVNEELDINLNWHDHMCIYYAFSIRPLGRNEDADPFNTNTDYCHYDKVHGDYVYTDEWIEFLVKLLSESDKEIKDFKECFKKGEKLDINEFEDELFD